MMDDELKQYLLAIEERLASRIEETERRLDARIEKTEQGLEARIEKTETNLLTAFHQWASPVEMRARSHSAAIRALDSEVEFLADRLTRLDGGGLPKL